MPGTMIPRGNIVNSVLFSTTLTPASVAANTTADQTFTIQGVRPGDYINGQSAVAQTTGVFITNVRVTANDTIAITFANVTAGGVVPVSGVYGFIWGRPEFLPLPANVV